jgi:hypothetical protein
LKHKNQKLVKKRGGENRSSKVTIITQET